LHAPQIVCCQLSTCIHLEDLVFESEKALQHALVRWYRAQT
jgi:hypothetical protein